MSTSVPYPKRVVIVGGGISGLSTAFSLLEEAERTHQTFQCTVLESQASWGGKIATTRVDEVIVEGGPDSFLSIKPAGLELCEKLGLSSQLINTNQGQSQTFAYSRGRLREFPHGLVSLVPTQIGPLLKSGLLSWGGVLRMAGDYFIPPRPAGEPEESLATFFIRRFGKEAFDRFIEPLVAGIYAGDASELSVEATFPQFVELERKYGGLIKGAIAQQQSRRSPNQNGQSSRSLFVTLRGGLGDLVSRLLEELEKRGVVLRLGTSVQSIRPEEADHGKSSWLVSLEGGECLKAEAIVLATPAYVSAHLLQELDPEVSNLLSAIPYASTATVSLVFAKDDVKQQCQGFGFVVPRIEQRQLIAGTWSSLKWEDRASAHDMLIRCYVGGRGREAILEKDDKTMVATVLQELRELVGIEAHPRSFYIFRWMKAMPQYIIGHRSRVNAIRQRLTAYPGLYVTGAAYHGLGIPDCIRDGNATAKAVSEWLGTISSPEKNPLPHHTGLSS